MTTKLRQKEVQQCYHCGSPCDEEAEELDDKQFCCHGCLTVYNVLNANGMGSYYQLEKFPGVRSNDKKDFTFAKNQEIVQSLLDYKDDEKSIITLRIPSIHCSSCIWLLENLQQLNPGVLSARVNFEKREVKITFSNSEIDLHEVLTLLDRIGYSAELQSKSPSTYSSGLIKKLALAGFCFGNIMLFSFPEYVGLHLSNDPQITRTFQFLNLLLAIPLVFYSGSVYLSTAWKSIKSRSMHIHIPISIGIVALFIQSSYEILSSTGSGYFDSLAGLIFFLLIGKWFQEFTYSKLVFDRTYDAYFPLSAQLIKEGTEETVPLNSLKEGDRVLIRKGELIPADGHVFRGTASIDYSFVTGESIPVHKELGEVIYAGGRQTGDAIEVELNKNVSQSKLISLWNDASFSNEKEESGDFTQTLGKYFTIGLLLIATATMVSWSLIDPSKALFSTVSVLIIACPCALALAYPFATGAALRYLAKKGVYIKNSIVLEKLSKVKRLVFDKTGTLTESLEFDTDFHGKPLDPKQFSSISSLAKMSDHPFSRSIFKSLKQYEVLPVDSFKEVPGKGVEGWVNDQWVKLGSAAYIFEDLRHPSQDHQVYVSIDGKYVGAFDFQNHYLPFLKRIWNELRSKGYRISILSGDTDREQKRLTELAAGSIDEFTFGATPDAKLKYVKSLNERTAYFGDGLNDAGALKVADVGVAVSKSLIHFTPASDVIITQKELEQTDSWMDFSKATFKTVKIGIIVSLLYNVVGLAFAVQGLLSPVLAAILMPVSSVTTVALMAFLTHLKAKRILEK